jgi:hypothetical protein
MPLRDHFRKPRRVNFRWEGFHSAWANTIVRELNTQLLPARYRAEPHVHFGTDVEVDIAAMKERPFETASNLEGRGAVAAVWSPPKPAMTLQADLNDPDIIEVRVYDDENDAQLVGAIEFVSPRNKDREDSRRDFVLKCAAYLRSEVALVIVDIVTTRRVSLFVELMDFMKQHDKAMNWGKKILYAVAMRPGPPRKRRHVDVWPHELRLGERLPKLPLWLSDNCSVPLDLEASYEETCQVLRAR